MRVGLMAMVIVFAAGSALAEGAKRNGHGGGYGNFDNKGAPPDRGAKASGSTGPEQQDQQGAKSGNASKSQGGRPSQ
jgi:hypothetical protein